MTLPPGFTVGHWTDPVARTGCSVILCEGGATAGVHMGGGAPATIQTDIIGPTSATAILHAVLLTGGSAFGLAAYGGVMKFLEEKGVGVEVGFGETRFHVPHVAGAVIFDLLNGDGTVRPDASAGYAACRMATDAPAEGLVGAGTGATVSKLMSGVSQPGGFGVFSLAAGAATVTAVMVVNALGDIWDGERNEWIYRSDDVDLARRSDNTTIGVVITDARLDRDATRRVAMTAHDGLARAIRPAHTDRDGDSIFSLANGREVADPFLIQRAAADAVEKAIVRAVRISGGTMKS
jgi:L-aminopeptidase/D-esterase-like protein